MAAYFREFARALIRHRISWWIGLGIAVALGVGIGDDYPSIRDTINAWQGVVILPQNISLWWFVVVPLAIWLIVSFAHNEAARELKSARLVFSEPMIVSTPLFNDGQLRENLEIVRISVQNIPKDMTHGLDVEEAYCEAVFYRRRDGKKLFAVDYCRWTQNEKPGYHPNPKRFVNAWNYRTLKANQDKNYIDFALSGWTNAVIWGFKAAAQQVPDWRIDNLKTDERDLLVSIVVKGKGLRRPAEKWVALRLSDFGNMLEIESTRSKPPKYWAGLS